MKFKNILPYVFSAGLSASCSYLPKPFEGVSTAQVERMHPGPAFRTWWKELSDCSGLSRSFDSIQWFHVKKDFIPCDNSETGLCAGIWLPPDSIFLPNRILSSLNLQLTFADFYKAEGVVKHELFHYLRDNPEHPDNFYICGVTNGF